jgi:hypothetical protein
MSDNQSFDPAERQRREWIDATVRGVIEEFSGRFELLSERAYKLATSIDLFYDVRDTLAGTEFKIIADTFVERDMGALAGDIRRQLNARARAIA